MENSISKFWDWELKWKIQFPSFGIKVQMKNSVPNPTWDINGKWVSWKSLEQEFPLMPAPLVLGKITQFQIHYFTLLAELPTNYPYLG